MKAPACRTVTAPLGMGRVRVRSTLAVEVAVDDVVEGAAGAAHGHRADAEQRHQPPIGPAPAPPARSPTSPESSSSQVPIGRSSRASRI